MAGGPSILSGSGDMKMAGNRFFSDWKVEIKIKELDLSAKNMILVTTKVDSTHQKWGLNQQKIWDLLLLLPSDNLW